jgi:type III restriction enzyme
MNSRAEYISHRLSLRAPQKASLGILSELLEEIKLEKDLDLSSTLNTVKGKYPTCSDFEREFFSICFALATGVGKTRLMGAFVSYLHLVKGINNFFILAPNLTIYNKLIVDFGEPSSSKYVFRGMSEFAQEQPVIITGDNYQEKGQTLSAPTDTNLNTTQERVHINVFNISKINAETRGGAEPKIKKLSEYLGESYFNYLAGLQDLVILMDESHHYRAERGMAVINELKPILGLELTATPQVERGSKTEFFKNVVYEYSLANAINDGYVKSPAVATRKNYNPKDRTPKEVELDKLKDGLCLHEETKAHLEIYSRDNKAKKVKPFVLVVARDTEHATELKELIESEGFFNGNYIGKVLQVDSKQTGAKKEEYLMHLLELEDPNNVIEIVIHVNMLKEGWDVTNLYTIIPLRAAESKTLIEQTIGRGLRLPYGERTGDNKVDRLTVIMHDKFQEVIDYANSEDSIIKKENIIEIEPEDIETGKDVVNAQSVLDEVQNNERVEIENTTDEKEKEEKVNDFAAKHVAKTIIFDRSNTEGVKSYDDLKKPEIKEKLVAKFDEKIRSSSTVNEVGFDYNPEKAKKSFEDNYELFLTEFNDHIIRIPRISISKIEEVEYYFEDFDLDTSSMGYNPQAEEILTQDLRTGIKELTLSKGQIVTDKLPNILIAHLMNFDDIDYSEDAELLHKLADQAVEYQKARQKNEDDLFSVMNAKAKDMSQLIYRQLKEHQHEGEIQYESTVLPYSQIFEHNLIHEINGKLHGFRETIEPASHIPKKIFQGFEKSCHKLYKFDSKTEKDFSIIIEDDDEVLKWLRPAKKQFNIWWTSSRQYEPDFVVETEERIYLVETKKRKDMTSDEVVMKNKAAVKFCHEATQHNIQNGEKEWRFAIIPHDMVLGNMGFMYLMEQYEKILESV